VPKQKKHRKKGRPRVPPKFKIGDHVRVKQGTTDADHPDFPLGGWAGTICESRRKGIYAVRWSRETLARIHPIFKKRCRLVGTMVEEYWLGEEDLESDPGGPLAIAQPEKIVPRPLSADDPEDRVRGVFGLTSDDFVPAVDDPTLAIYRDYLARELSFPFPAKHPHWDPATGLQMRPIRILGLVEDDPSKNARGILCEARVGDECYALPLAALVLHPRDPNYKLLDDYGCWFADEMAGESDEDESDEEDRDRNNGDGSPGEDDAVRIDANWRGVALSLLEIVAVGVTFFAFIGAALAAIPWTWWGAGIGGGLFGILGAVAEAAGDRKKVPFLWKRFNTVLGGLRGLTVGALLGMCYGVMAVAFVGAALGGIVGLLLRRLSRSTDGPLFYVVPRNLSFAAACGVVAQAYYLDGALATDGLRLGALVGLGMAILFCLVSWLVLFLFARKIRGFGSVHFHLSGPERSCAAPDS
jgi:hypothetical protein